MTQTPTPDASAALLQLAEAWVRGEVGYEHACMAGDGQLELERYDQMREDAKAAFIAALSAPGATAQEGAERIVAEFQVREDTLPAAGLFVWLRNAIAAALAARDQAARERCARIADTLRINGRQARDGGYIAAAIRTTEESPEVTQ